MCACVCCRRSLTRAVCLSDPTERPVTPTPRPTAPPSCVSDLDCPDNQVCYDTLCKNPCDFDNMCAPNALCDTRAHRPQCRCPPGSHGDARLECLLDERKTRHHRQYRRRPATGRQLPPPLVYPCMLDNWPSQMRRAARADIRMTPRTPGTGSRPVAGHSDNLLTDCYRLRSYYNCNSICCLLPVQDLND